jgi:hypothetical protein
MLRKALLVATVLLMIVPVGSAVAAGPPTSFSLPDQASEVAPGVFFLGYAVEDGVELEGYAYARYATGDERGRSANAKPEGNPGKGGGNGGGNGGGATDPASCYSYIANGARWVNSEGYLFDSTNSTIGTVSVAATDAAFTTWELATEDFDATNGSGPVNIVNDGTLYLPDPDDPADKLSADTTATDGLNEIYFAPIADENVLGYTIVWSTRSRGPFVGQIVEADMVIDDAGWNWYTDSDGTIVGGTDPTTAEIDFWGVFTHEAGHWVGMGHTDRVTECEQQTMYPSVGYGDVSKRTIEVGDEAGIFGLYN